MNTSKTNYSPVTTTAKWRRVFLSFAGRFWRIDSASTSTSARSLLLIPLAIPLLHFGYLLALFDNHGLLQYTELGMLGVGLGN